MKKLVEIMLLLFIIAPSFLFIWAKSQAVGAEDNYFNTHWRARAAAYPGLRQVLALHWDGDAKADYLGKRYQKILVEVDVMEGMEMSLDALALLTQKIQGITGKTTAYLISDRQVPYEAELSEESRAALVRKYRTHKNLADTATLYLLYGSRDPETPTELGVTHQEYGVILFGGALKEFTKSNPKTLGSYEESTALHEFGHQLGLPHNDRAGCLMNEHAEEAQAALERPEEVIIDFCEYEKQAIPIIGI